MSLTMRDIALKYSVKQPQQVDALTEEAPILDTATYQKTTHGLKHAYEELESVTGASFVEMDAPLSTVDATTKLKWEDLAILGGKHEVGQDKVKQFGSIGAYLSDKESAIFSVTGQGVEQELIYNRFEVFAKKNNKLVSATATPSGSVYYSMYCIRWQDGQLTGLFDPNGFGKGALLEPQAINGGNVYFNSDGVLVYGISWKSYIGYLLANPRNIAGIVNINIASLPSNFPELIDQMLDNARVGSGGKAIIYMHRKLFTALFKYKVERLQMGSTETNINRSVGSWNGVPIVSSYNFKNGTEAAIIL